MKRRVWSALAAVSLVILFDAVTAGAKKALGIGTMGQGTLG